MIRNRIVALLFRTSILIVIVLGLLNNFGVFRGTFTWGALMFYTVQSNILGLVLFCILLFRTIRDITQKGPRGPAGYFARFEFVCTVNLLLTLAVYWLLLAPQPFAMTENSSIWSFANLSVHLIAPLGCLIDYILFTKSKKLKYPDVYKVLIFPFAYLAFASIAGLLGYTYHPATGATSHYPYPFMDYDKVGIQALVYIAGIALALLAVGHLLYLFDQKIKKPQLLG